MKTISLKCVILGHKNFGEADKLIFLYSDRLGKIKAIARGARKITSKFGGHLETLNICLVSLYFGPKNTILTEIDSDEDHKKLLENLDTLSSALQIAEITNALLYENQSLENLERLIEKTLQHLSRSAKPTLIAMGYIIKLLDKIGLIPDFKQTEFSLELKYRKFFQFLKDRTFSEIEKIDLSQVERNKIKNFIKHLIEEQTNRRFASFLP